MVEFYDPITKQDISFYLNPRLKANLDSIKDRLTKKDQDYVLIVDGSEGSGKSVFAMQIAKYVDPSLDLSRICMNGDQFKQAIVEAKPHQAVIFDEAFTGLSSRSSLSEINRSLVSMMMQMRQKNLFVLIVLPSVFMIDKYVNLSRSRGLFHIWVKNNNHYWKCFNKNKLKRLILTGSKTYSYNQVGKFVYFKGNFYGKYVIDEDAYRNKKRRALEAVEEVVNESKYLIQRNKLFHIMNSELGLKEIEIVKLCHKHGISLKQQSINSVLGKFKEKPHY